VTVKLMCAVLVGSLVCAGGVGLTAAHALLLESTPRAGDAGPSPARLMLRFNSRIEKPLSTVMLVGGPRNTRIMLLRSEPEAGPDTLVFGLPQLEPGRYRVEWKVLSVDGHFTEGVVNFTVIATPGRAGSR
jgi:methionine-rich copper-binding protein CopC